MEPPFEAAATRCGYAGRLVQPNSSKEKDIHRRSILLGVATALFAGLCLTLPAFTPAPVDGGPSGTYLVRFASGPATLLGIGVVHPDGTWSMVDQTDNGAIPGFTSRQSVWRDIWHHSGPQQTTLNGICLNFNALGIPIGSQRVDGALTWEPGFRTGSGFASQRKYTNTENPLDPNGGTAEPPPLDQLPVSVVKMVQ